MAGAVAGCIKADFFRRLSLVNLSALYVLLPALVFIYPFYSELPVPDGVYYFVSPVHMLVSFFFIASCAAKVMYKLVA